MDRMRRLRMNETLRDMVRENHVRVDELIYPVFVAEGENICHPVESMPGICQYSIDSGCRGKGSSVIWNPGT